MVKILQSRFCLRTLFNDAHDYNNRCLCCQQLCKIGRKDIMPLTLIVVVNIFVVQGIDFTYPFLNSFGNEYILLCVDCVFKWGSNSQINKQVCGHHTSSKGECFCLRIGYLEQSLVINGFILMTGPLMYYSKGIPSFSTL